VPIYDFHCVKCNIDSEKMMKYSETENVKCDVCGSRLNKVVAGKMNFQLIYSPEKHLSSWGSEGYSSSQYNRCKNGD